jgi:SnoaL-like domain
MARHFFPTATSVPKAIDFVKHRNRSFRKEISRGMPGRLKDGNPVPGPSRFTMLITKSGGEWRIAHHHSSPHVQEKK